MEIGNKIGTNIKEVSLQVHCRCNSGGGNSGRSMCIWQEQCSKGVLYIYSRLEVNCHKVHYRHDWLL